MKEVIEDDVERRRRQPDWFVARSVVLATGSGSRPVVCGPLQADLSQVSVACPTRKRREISRLGRRYRLETSRPTRDKSVYKKWVGPRTSGQSDSGDSMLPEFGITGIFWSRRRPGVQSGSGSFASKGA